MTQGDLAKRSGLGQPYISKIENQGIKGPSLACVASLASALGIDSASLIDGTSYTSDLAEKLSEEQIGYCPALQCPESNWAELSKLLAFPILDYSEHSWTFPADAP
jgi:transcriptional regulator with XRE-family HTH domain